MTTASLAHRRAFLTVILSQFISSLADNALLIAAIGLLVERHASAWTTPALRLFFYLSYVLLAAFAGAVADAVPKPRVMLITNLLKLGGCALLLTGAHPLIAYTLVGAGAAAYSPAKYGILSELLPQRSLVGANAWIEVTTVLSILLGVGLGSLLMAPAMPLPHWMASRAGTATALIAVLYVLAVACSALIPATPASNPYALARPPVLMRQFHEAMRHLWNDAQAQVSLAVTSLFWAVSATLQFLVLRWAEEVLHLQLSQAALLQIAVAGGMICGAIAAARSIPLQKALNVLPLGLAMAGTVSLLLFIKTLILGVALLFITGLLSGLFLVPMNALLQHRGHTLMHPGQSIAVQNFSENLASLLLLTSYGILVIVHAGVLPTIAGFGAFVGIAMLFIMKKQKNNDRVRARYAYG
ncbi:MAG: lysophospholipid transporter LplT [Burkholderiaceae bacterium]